MCHGIATSFQVAIPWDVVLRENLKLVAIPWHVVLRKPVLLTLGAHAQRGLQYLYEAIVCAHAYVHRVYSMKDKAGH